VANPVLSRPDAWTHNLPQPQPHQQQPGDQSYGAQYGQPYTQYGQQPPVGQPGYGQQQYRPSAPQQVDRMTVDDVITKTSITMGVMMLVAVAAAKFLPLNLLLPVAMVSGLVAFIVPLIVAVRRSIGPVLAIGTLGTVLLNAAMPWSASVNVWSGGKTASGSDEEKCTVPRYDASMSPLASTGTTSRCPWITLLPPLSHSVSCEEMASS